MPLFDQTLASHRITGSTYGFSAKRIEDLGASEYTLVVITADDSGSVSPFRRDIEMCIGEVVRACNKSARADNLMLRLTRFDDALHEVHGFKPAPDCDPGDYDGCLVSGGCTALYDAAHNAVASVVGYGTSLSRADFDVNGIVFVVTDGMDNASSCTAANVKKALRDAVRSETMRTLVSVLIGVDVRDAATSQYLEDLADQAGFTEYLELGDADADTLAGLADFVSRSIASQSQSLATGAPVSLSF